MATTPEPDLETAREQGREAARGARGAGCPMESYGDNDIAAGDWQALEGALGRKVYGYGPEGVALGRAWAEGWDEVAAEDEAETSPAIIQADRADPGALPCDLRAELAAHPAAGHPPATAPGAPGA